MPENQISVIRRSLLSDRFEMPCSDILRGPGRFQISIHTCPNFIEAWKTEKPTDSSWIDVTRDIYFIVRGWKALDVVIEEYRPHPDTLTEQERNGR